jgi:four helix bundle protein
MRGARHRSFAAYRYAATLADEVHEEVARWSKFDTWTVGIQLVRAADSIGANIAEGLGRATLNDQRRFFLMARGSLLETEHWLERAAARGLPLSAPFIDKTEELGRVLNGLIRANPTGST